MRNDIISMNLIDIVTNVTELTKKLSQNIDYIDIDGYSENILTLMDILESVKIIDKQLIEENE